MLKHVNFVWSLDIKNEHHFSTQVELIEYMEEGDQLFKGYNSGDESRCHWIFMVYFCVLGYFVVSCDFCNLITN